MGARFLEMPGYKLPLNNVDDFAQENFTLEVKKPNSMSTTNAPLKVGVVGLSTTGWASSTIAPSLLDPDLRKHIKLTAILTSRAESADASARKYSELTGSLVKPYHGDAEQLISDPDVDFVVVSVKVLHHREVVEKSIARGKAFFVEWPVGKSLEETKELARLVKEKGLKNVVGLQGRQSVITRKVKRIIDSGKIGKLMVVTVNFLVPRELRLWAPITTSNFAYSVDRNNGATLLSTAAAQALDNVFQAFGPLKRLSASGTTLYPTVTVIDDNTNAPTGVTLPSQFPDHITITGLLKDSGAWITIIIRQGHPSTPGRTQLLWDIDGEGGTLKVEDTRPLGWVVSAREPENVFLNGDKLEWNDEEDGERAESVVPFMKNTWLEFLKGKESGGRFADIDDAVKLKEILFAIETSLDNDGRWIDLE
ncbi:hypothetical protein NMY22_g18403 [Coprinellus aureogranulatus]|nr:hypothetical protein NMY22_g18403 [Coprinellus aureogranulatus]